ncbi:hypothetical protein [Paenibacillus thermotolerans]|uniref:hypothetical protein n=1 Tax=Paenibacillus thermotolerans TaxID=3027807 RepID=UPI0023684EB9|nr:MULTISPECIES: hypothetical protein [unclassified Paenibacillus]
MRVPNFGRSPGFMQAVGLVLAGIVVGAVAMMIVESNNYQIVIEQNIQLQAENSRLQEDVANLEKLKNRRYVIKKTSVTFEGEALERKIASELEARILQNLEFAVGNPASIDPTVYRALVDGHEYRDINGSTYRVRVTMLSVNQTELRVFVKATQVVAN